MNKIRVGILFGGRSREREISFAGGRTVYDNLDRRYFTPVPIFIDSLGLPLLLQPEFLYRGTIRDFYPSAQHYQHELPHVQRYVEHLVSPLSPGHYQLAEEIGESLTWDEVAGMMDIAFLALHGTGGEDGSIQGLLETFGIPYTGAGIPGAALGMDKILQANALRSIDLLYKPRRQAFPLPAWEDDLQALAVTIRKHWPAKFVLKHPTQGSSIGVAIVQEEEEVRPALQKVAFRLQVHPAEWRAQSESEQQAWLARFVDIRTSVGLPCWALREGLAPQYVQDVVKLRQLLCEADAPISLIAPDAPSKVLIEEFFPGREFSVIVLETLEGHYLPLPPTEIIKTNEVFDYRAKYLPGLVRKQTPMPVEDKVLTKIRSAAVRVMKALHIRGVARIDGLLREDGEVMINDPNTTSGMLPGSFFFQQAAQAGISPRDLLTHLIRSGLGLRAAHYFRSQEFQRLLETDFSQAAAADPPVPVKRVAVLLGGYSSERHISQESGRNVVEKLRAAEHWQPEALFLLHHERLKQAGNHPALNNGLEFSLWKLPVHLLLKDNADDVAEAIVNSLKETANEKANLKGNDLFREAEEALRAEVLDLQYFAPEYVPIHRLKSDYDFVFLGLHGRPGEDGTLQAELEQRGIPFNGSGAAAARIAIDKAQTADLLREQDISTAKQFLLLKEVWEKEGEASVFRQLEELIGYPMVCKPVDDGCSSAVKRIDTLEELRAYCQMAFRATEEWPSAATELLELRSGEAFPQYERILVEELIQAPAGFQQKEITIGFLSVPDPQNPDGGFRREVFVPSDAVAGGKVLSLEEKFLAGEGQNITPARFSRQEDEQQSITQTVQTHIAKVIDAMGLEGYGRIDAFVQWKDDEVIVRVIEVNNLPGLTPATAIFHQAAHAGYTPLAFLEAIIAHGFRRESATAGAFKA